MTEQKKLKRLLEMLDYLQPPGNTKINIATYIGVSTRTVERYFELFEETGFSIEKDAAKRFFIFQAFKRGIQINLSQQEADLISDMLNQNAATHPLTNVIQAKLFFKSQTFKVTKNEFRKFIPKVIQQLSDAMKLNRQVSINKYFSASTGATHQSRIVSPLKFTENYTYLIAYEQTKNKFINLRLDRIAAVEILDAECLKSPNDVEVDVFQIAGNEKAIEVNLLLSPLAYRLLLEEHPRTESYISKNKDDKYTHQLITKVYNFLPIGRFCLGLPLDIKVVKPNDLKTYLDEKVDGRVW